MSNILIVGGLTGIGQSLALFLLTEGHKVVTASRRNRNDENIDSACQHEIVDARNPESLSLMFARIGNVDHIISTIRGPGGHSSIYDIDNDNEIELFRTKYIGQSNIVRIGHKYLSPGGSIILTSGIASHCGIVGFMHIAGVNAAIEAMVRVAARELESKCRINVVCPGFVCGTADNDELRIKSIQSSGKSIPMMRMATYDEIAMCYSLIMKTTYMNGSVVVVDGGIST